MPAGLYDKYIVQKTSGEPIDEGAEYFVLRVDTDGDARAALNFYATLIQKKNSALSRDLQDRLGPYKL